MKCKRKGSIPVSKAKWVELSPETTTILDSGICSFINEQEQLMKELIGTCGWTIREDEEYIKAGIWLETAKNTLTALRSKQCLAVGLLIEKE